MNARGELEGRRIAVTRPDAGELGRRLRELGAAVIHVPLIAIEAAADGGAALTVALDRLADFDWLVVTSANGARRVGPAARAHPRVRLGAVGPVTADALAIASRREVDLVASTPRAAGLVADFPPTPARVLIAQAEEAGAVLTDGLAAAGHDVTVVAAYRTVTRRPTPSDLDRLATVDAVVLASGSAARAYADAVGTSPADRLVVAIGPVTARSARTAGLSVTHVARSPDTDAVVDLLVEAFGA